VCVSLPAVRCRWWRHRRRCKTVSTCLGSSWPSPATSSEHRRGTGSVAVVRGRGPLATRGPEADRARRTRSVVCSSATSTGGNRRRRSTCTCRRRYLDEECYDEASCCWPTCTYIIVVRSSSSSAAAAAAAATTISGVTRPKKVCYWAIPIYVLASVFSPETH